MIALDTNFLIQYHTRDDGNQTRANMWEDPIIRELHEIRQAHAENFGNDLKAICEDIRKSAKESCHMQANIPIREKRIPNTHRPPC